MLLHGKEEFNYLLTSIKDAITVHFARSRQSTQGNDPIFPEIIQAIGLRYLAHGDLVITLADLYCMSIPSAKRVINMFLDAIDFNDECPELAIKLPRNAYEIHELAERWEEKSTGHGLMRGHVAALDGYFASSICPFDVDNQQDYYSGHYMSHGLNIQAMSDPDLLFLYFGTIAPGKTNNYRVFGWCTALQEWLEYLPDGYYTSADNAYALSRKVLTPFKGVLARGEYHNVYNFFLSQHRVRVEMAFGRMTTKWRRLRQKLTNSTEKNARICRVCAKLHNFCIRMKQKRGEGFVPRFEGSNPDPQNFGIDPIDLGGNRRHKYGFLPTPPAAKGDAPSYESLHPDPSLREEKLSQVESRGRVCSQAKVLRNKNR